MDEDRPNDSPRAGADEAEENQDDAGEAAAVLPSPAPGYRAVLRNWMAAAGVGDWLVPGQRGASPGPRIVLDPPLAERFRVDLRLAAAGMDVLRVRCRSKGPEGLRWRDVFVDVARPGALDHDLDRVALAVTPQERGVRVRLELEGGLEAEETLRELALDPVTVWFQEAAAAPEMALRIDGVDILPAVPTAPRTPYVASRYHDLSEITRGRGKQRDAVLFAWWVPDHPEARKVGEYYLGLLKYHHPDSRIFLGVNHGSDPALVAAAAASGMDIEICPVPAEIAVNSDAAGFMTALEALHHSGEPFDLVWFGHTKGASQPRYTDYRLLRYWQERGFWARRAETERAFRDPKIGLLAMHYNPTPTYPFPRPWHGWTGELAALQRIYRGDLPPLGLNALDTFFVLRGEIVRGFCEAAGEGFFRSDPHEYGGSRWFFEMAFPSIATMQGYEPFIDMDVPGANDPREDIILDGDMKQNHRLAQEELRRWREDPAGFQPRILPWDRPVWRQQP